MVKSSLNSSINYAEQKKIDPEDIEYDAQPWEINLLNEDVLIALGKEKYTHINKNIVYFPIYLIKNNKVDSQIGVYETRADKLPVLLDEDGDIDIEGLDKPLLYSFVNRNLLYTEDDNKEEVDPEDPKENDDPEDPDEPPESSDDEQGAPDDDDDDDVVIIDSLDKDKEKVISIDDSFQKLPDLSEQLEADAKLEREKIIGKERPWVSKFMHNQNYEIEEVGSGGDCLFHVIRAALASIGKKTTVSKLRNRLSKEADQNTFEQYKNIYDGIKLSLDTSKKELKSLVSENKRLKLELSKSKDRKNQMDIISKAKEIKSKYDQEKKELSSTKSMFSEYEFMEGITNLAAFRKIIKTCTFWAETWAISTLERVLNIKLILLSSEAFNHGDLSNVVQCGQFNDDILKQSGIFEPDHYIITNYLGYHYQLIKYKDRAIFSFKEIPYDLKLKIVEKCLEKNGGPYSIIPDFQHFQKSLEKSGKLEEDEELDSNEYNPDKPDSEDELNNPLYTEDIVFQFYNKSSGKPLPGKGSGETISSDKRNEFSKLASIPNWRRKLSNFSIGKFECDGKEWNSVEHFYQANKYKNSNEINHFYDSFSLDSGSELSKDPILAKASSSKTGKYNGKEIRPDGVSMDMDFMGKRREKTMQDGLYCKFNQIPEYKELLLETKNAKLQHFEKSKPPSTNYDLMKVRQKLAVKKDI